MDKLNQSMGILNEQAQVCVIGNLNVDLIIRNVPKLPEWGQEVLGTDQLLVSSGQAGYLVFALSRLGVPTCLIGNVGQDLYGKQILADLESFGLDTSGVEVTPDQPSGITVAIVRPDGERAFVTNLGALTSFDAGTVERHWHLAEKSRLVALVGLFMLPGLGVNGAIEIFKGARASGKITMLDTGWDPAGWSDKTIRSIELLLQEVNIFLPNQDEATAITGERDVIKAMDLLHSMGPDLVVIKCGAEGSYTRVDNQTIHLPAKPVVVYDAVGAGDVFNAGIVTALRWGWPIEACLAFGNTVSSLYISRATDRFPKLEAVKFAARSTYPIIPITS